MKACPECDSPVHATVDGYRHDKSHAYRCAECDWKGDAIIIREKHRDRGAGNHGVSKKLAEANPEDWP